MLELRNAYRILLQNPLGKTSTLKTEKEMARLHYDGSYEH